MANEPQTAQTMTTIRIKATPDGNNCTLEIVEDEAKTGTRIDQRVARVILEIDKIMQDPQFIQAMQSMQMQSGQMGRWQNPTQRPMMPYGMPMPNPGSFGGGGMNFGGGQNMGF